MRPIACLIALAALAAAATRIADPEAFVRQVYRSIEARPSEYAPPRDIYTSRIRALMAEDTRRAKGEVGCLDFDVWTNSQDPQGIRDIRISSLPESDPNRRTVAAKFILGEPQEIRFEFRRMGGRWLLDEVICASEPRWTLSELLRCWNQPKPPVR